MSDQPLERIEFDEGLDFIIEKLRSLEPGKQGAVIVFSEEAGTVVMARGIGDECIVSVLYDAIAIASEKV